MARHTTSFTTDPRFRARQEVRNRLQRLVEEAKTTAGCMESVGGENVETQMWREVVLLAGDMVNGLNAINENERQDKKMMASAVRLRNLIGKDSS